MTEMLWYAGRASGAVSLTLFTAVLVLGIASRSGRQAFGLPRFALTAVHRYASLLGVAFLGLHVLTLLADRYSKLTLLDVVVPFGAGYRPMWTGLGTVALDLVIAVVVTSLLRRRIGVRVWRAVHWLAYAAWPIALVHGLMSGTDAGSGWLLALTAACVAAVLGALGWRLSPRFGAVLTTGAAR
jgi:sulfoxide reductase heme-binding subunit YedZ